MGATPARRGGGKVRTRAAGPEGGGSCNIAQPSRRAGRARSRWRNLSVFRVSFPPPQFGAGPENGFGDGVVS